MIENKRIHQATEHRELAEVDPHYLTETARSGLAMDHGCDPLDDGPQKLHRVESARDQEQREESRKEPLVEREQRHLSNATKVQIQALYDVCKTMVGDPSDQRDHKPVDEPNRVESDNAMEDRADRACIILGRLPSKRDAAFIESLSNPLKWHGGKTYLAPWILSHMPPHAHYVEPFAGGLAVLLAKEYEGVSEVVNDLDKELMNFWDVLARKELFEEFVRVLQATPFSQEVFRIAGSESVADTPVERAVRFFVRCRQSRQGLRKDFATLSKNRTRRNMNEQVSSWLTAVEGLPAVHDRLKRVVMLNDDAVAIIKREDSPNTLFYVDPTYLHETRTTTRDYVHEMTENDHARLLTVLTQIKGKFLLSGYRSAIYDDAAASNGWYRVEREIDCKASGAKKKPKRIECLWMNYQPNDVQC
jgi:DNA adenine methylase